MQKKKFINNSKLPSSMTYDVFELNFAIADDLKDKVWDYLQKRETFIKPQIFPFRVEFETGLTHGLFKSGEKNIHHGPLLSVHGEIGEVSNAYRSLYYYYGSYVLSFRFFRPLLLEFEKSKDGIVVRLHSYVHNKLLSIWRLGNNLFWQNFKTGLKKLK